jgi:three-Cys-motif partner protein
MIDRMRSKIENKAKMTVEIDEVGYWSEIKLEILEKYAKPYNQILRSKGLHPFYIDGFAGAGHHVAKGSERVIDGSPTRALAVRPPFEAFHFIDLDPDRVARLKQLSKDRRDVHVYCEDCNEVLVKEIFPKIAFERRERALCILDPYGLQLNWDTIKSAGSSGVVEIFLNFPVMDMNRNVLWRNEEHVMELHKERMTRFWGDESWSDAAYKVIPGLFEEMREKASNADVAEAFQNRLREVAGFKYVPKPMPMRNSRGAIVYYLFFAAQQQKADKIVKQIFAKYGNRLEDSDG